MTNREWLMEQMQNMSDKELGEKIARTSEKCEFCLIEPEYECGTELRCCADEVKNWLKAEHKEKPKLTEAERVILENVNEDFVCVGKNEDGEIYFQYKNGDRYWADIFDFEIFKFIKEDAEPYSIKKLLKGE